MISRPDIFERIIFTNLTGEIAPVPAGIFNLDSGAGVGRFSYGRRYLHRTEAIALDPVNLPLSDQEYTTKNNSGIFGVISDLLPDSWGKQILAKHLGISPISLKTHEMFDYVTSNSIGALSIGLTPDQPTTKHETPVSASELHMVADVFKKALSERQLPADYDHLLGLGASLGGSHPKCPVILDGNEWIAKFDNPMTPLKLPSIEFGTMLMAKNSGINVPEINLGEVTGHPVYLIKRFDRLGQEHLPFMSAHTISAADLIDQGRGSYIEIARHMRKFVKNVSRDLNELFRRMVFNVFVRNQDDHLRNHGFIYRDKGWHLAPLYDVLPSPSAKSSANYSLSLNIGVEGALAKSSNLYSQHEEFNLSHDQAVQIIAEIFDATADWETTLRDCQVSKEDIESVRWSFEGFRELS